MSIVKSSRHNKKCLKLRGRLKPLITILGILSLTFQTVLFSVMRRSRRWDTAIFKLKGKASDFATLGVVSVDSAPPAFGSPVYNIGAPIGTPFKLSPRAHVLRHSLFDGKLDPFNHGISGYGTYTSDLDQFSGKWHTYNGQGQLKIYHRQLWWSRVRLQQWHACWTYCLYST